MQLLNLSQQHKTDGRHTFWNPVIDCCKTSHSLRSTCKLWPMHIPQWLTCSSQCCNVETKRCFPGPWLRTYYCYSYYYYEQTDIFFILISDFTLTLSSHSHPAFDIVLLMSYIIKELNMNKSHETIRTALTPKAGLTVPWSTSPSSIFSSVERCILVKTR